MYRKIKLLLSFVVLLLAAACARTESPRLIAALPSGGEGQSYPVPPIEVVHDAYLEIEVFNPSAAAEKTAELVVKHGGYMLSSQTTHWESAAQVTVVLAVPAYNFESLRGALGRLGNVRHERLYAGWRDGGWDVYSEVTVDFQPAGPRLPNLSSGWSPGRTFRQAFDVFLTVFGFLADILIWALVVVGPFILLAWIARRVWRWRRSRTP
jgi:hypothetical protein